MGKELKRGHARGCGTGTTPATQRPARFPDEGREARLGVLRHCRPAPVGKDAAAQRAPDLLAGTFPQERAFIEDPAKLKWALCTRRAAKSVLPECADDRKTRALDAQLRNVDAKDLVVAGVLPGRDDVQQSGRLEESGDRGRGKAAAIEIALGVLLRRRFRQVARCSTRRWLPRGKAAAAARWRGLKRNAGTAPPPAVG